MKNTDRRVVKTKKLILDTVMDLLSEKRLQDITVKEVTDLANIDRKTFYNHYGSIYEIVEEQEDKFIEYVVSMLDKNDILKDVKNPGKILVEIARKSKEFSVYSKILKTDHGLIYGIKLAEKVKDRMMDSMLKMKLTPEEAEIFAIYVFSGIVAVYRHLRTSGSRINFELASDILDRLCTGTFNMLHK